jgi:hypothetical protein
VQRKLILALALLLVLSLPARAQTRTLQVPAGADVVIPPRGAAPLPQLHATTRARRVEAADPWAESGADINGPSPWAYALVPLAAGAIAALVTNLPGGGGGGAASSGPVRTR